MRSPFARALALATFALAFARPAHAWFPNHTDAVPVPAVDFGFPLAPNGATFSLPPQMVDLDQDGRAEILAISDQGTLYAVGSQGVPDGGYPHAFGEPASGPPAVGDLNLDGNPDVVIVFRSGRVKVLTGAGAFLFQSQVPGTPVGGPVLTELDGSGRQCILVATTDGKLHALDSNGAPVAGFPLTGPGVATGGAFTFLAADNFPRIGYLASPGGAAIWRKTAVDAPYSFDPGVPVGPGMPVSGPRPKSGLNDADNLYLAGRGGQLWRFDPDAIIGGGGDPVPLAGVGPDSVLDTPCLFDVDGDLIPEIALRSYKADTLSIWIKDSEAGTTLAAYPQKFPGSLQTGAIVAADLGDGATSEIVFNHGGDKVSCLRINGTLAWTLTGLPSKGGPAIGDMEGDGSLDMAILTTDGKIYAYTLGNAGVGPRGIEWPDYDGTADHARKHHLRDHAALRAQWPAFLSPPSAYLSRPVIADVTGDGLTETVWSDSLSRKVFAWGQATDSLSNYAQLFNNGSLSNDAPAVGDVTGDGVDETVQSTATGSLVWGNRNGQLNNMLIDSGKILTPPVLADLNADGTLDAIVGSSSGRLYAANLKTKTLIPGFPVTTPGAIWLPPAVGDVNGDGQTDIVCVAGLRNITAYPRTGVTPLTGWPRVFPSGSTLTQPILVPVAGNAGLAVSFGQARTDSVFAHLVGGNSANKTGWPRRLVGTAIFGPVAGPFDNDATVDLVFTTNTDSMYVFVANGNRALTKWFDSGGDVEPSCMVDVDLDQRPDIILVNDHSELDAVRFNGLLTRSFDRLVFYLDAGQPPAFGDMGRDGSMDMVMADLGTPVVYTFGFGSWDARYAPWPMKGHDPRRTNAFSGLTVVGAFDAGPPIALQGYARAFPNPAVGRIALSHSRPLIGRFEAAIFDLRGRLVRRVAEGEARPGDGPPTWTWDGADERGVSAAPGVYFYRVVDGGGSLATRIVRL